MQSEQAVLDAPDIIPAMQLKQVDAPAAENFPAAQFKQSVEAVAPVVGKYFPLRQLTQLAPANAYVPATQLMQAEEVLDPVVDIDFPAGQFAQTDEPCAIEYVPKPQLLQSAEVDDPVSAR